MTNNLNKILLDNLFFSDADSFVEIIYNHQSLIDATNSQGESLLHFACYHGLVEKFIILLNMGATPSKTNNNDTLLHYTALGGNDYFLFHQLIKDGFDLLDRNTLGATPFHLCKNISLASFAYRYLQMKETNFQLKAIIDIYGNTPAHTAAQNNHWDVLEFFIQEEPEIAQIKNNFGQLPIDVPQQPYLICQNKEQ